jgi:hypothetical protein
VEAEYGQLFEEHGATFRVKPMRVSHLFEVGEGVELRLSPHEPGEWQWWGDFESDLEVRRRRRLSGFWHELLDEEEVDSWLRSETELYLSRLRGRSL